MLTNQIRDVEVHLGFPCNNNCIFCMANKEYRKNKFFSYEKVIKQISAYAKKGFNSIGFLGGEPTLHPRIIDIVRHANKAGMKSIHIVTNGRRLADGVFLNNLIASGVNRISVSIHSHLPKLEDNLTQVQGSFSQKLNGLHNIIQLQRKNKSINVSINIVINKMNIKSISESVKYFANLGYKDYRLNFIQTEGSARDNFEKLIPYYKNVYVLFKKVVDFAKKNTLTVSFADLPFCVIDKYPEFYKYTSELKDCYNFVVMMGAPNCDRTIKHFSWENVRKNELKMKPKKCNRCQYNKICEGIWKEYAKRIGYTELIPRK
ncbi:MAG: radical SAM protein [Candidatus Margulisbacteria bacterium]|nr:radical SAM protein [Candidatus Margulisiibacteriota bacterium]